MKRINSMLSLVLALMMIFSSCAFAETTAHDLTNGVFSYWLEAPGRDPMYCFIHFYDTGIFYASMFGGKQFALGTYEVVDGEYAYQNGDGEDRTAPQSIVMTTQDGNPYCTVGYNAEKGFLEPVSVMYNAIFSWEEYNPDLAQENGVALYEFVNPEDEYSMVAINHNSTYLDTVDVLVEGTWTLADDVYTLKDDESDDVATLTLKDNGTRADYTAADGTVTELTLKKAAEKKLSFKGSNSEGALGQVDAVIDCYDNGEATLVMTVHGSEQAVPGGSWELAADYSHITLNVRGTEYIAAINPEDHSFSFDMTMDVNGEALVFPMSSK